MTTPFHDVVLTAKEVTDLCAEEAKRRLRRAEKVIDSESGCLVDFSKFQTDGVHVYVKEGTDARLGGHPAVPETGRGQ